MEIPSTPCYSIFLRGELHHGHRSLRSERAISNPRLRDDGFGPRHEQLDGRSLPLSRRSDRTRKVLSAADLDRLGGFARYKDLDGDGVGYRTLPATAHPAAAYFTRGSGHNENATYTEREDDYIHNVDRLNHKFESMRKAVLPPVVDYSENASIGFVACGTSHYAVRAAIQQEGIQSRYELSPPAVLSVQSGSAGLHSPPRPRTWWTRISGRAIAGADASGVRTGRHRQATQRALLRRSAARRANHYRRERTTGGFMRTTSEPRASAAVRRTGGL